MCTNTAELNEVEAAAAQRSDEERSKPTGRVREMQTSADQQDQHMLCCGAGFGAGLCCDSLVSTNSPRRCYQKSQQAELTRG